MADCSLSAVAFAATATEVRRECTVLIRMRTESDLGFVGAWDLSGDSAAPIGGDALDLIEAKSLAPRLRAISAARAARGTPVLEAAILYVDQSVPWLAALQVVLQLEAALVPKVMFAVQSAKRDAAGVLSVNLPFVEPRRRAGGSVAPSVEEVGDRVDLSILFTSPETAEVVASSEFFKGVGEHQWIALGTLPTPERGVFTNEALTAIAELSRMFAGRIALRPPSVYAGLSRSKTDSSDTGAGGVYLLRTGKGRANTYAALEPDSKSSAKPWAAKAVGIVQSPELFAEAGRAREVDVASLRAKRPMPVR